MKDRDEIFKAAHQYVVKGRIDDAISEYLKILPYSTDGNIHNLLGDLYLKKESPDEAIKYFREAAAISNKHEFHAKTIALYHKILFINPDQLDVVIELAELNAVRGFIKQAVDGLRRAAEVYYAKGLPLKAMGVYKKALSICPSDIELKIKIADLHLDTNHTDRAIQMYLAIAQEYEAHDETVKAIYMYKKIISLDPENIEALTHLSRLAEFDQDLERAMEYMSKAAAIAPDNTDIQADYSHLASKANIDISQHEPQVLESHDHNEPQPLHIPDAVNNKNAMGNAHEPLDLSPESRNTSNPYPGQPLSAATSPLPVTSSGESFEDTGFTVPHDAGETGTEKNRIWDDRLYDDKHDPSVIDTIQKETLKAVTDHDTAEAEYDQQRGAYERSLSEEVTVHEKTEKDGFRLKRRVKKNKLHMLFILFIFVVTGLSFFVTFAFLKNTQTDEIESQKNVLQKERLPITELRTTVSNSDTSKTFVQNIDDAQGEILPETIKTDEHIHANKQEVLTLPVRDTGSVGEGLKIKAENTDEMTLLNEENLPMEIQTEVIESAREPDSEIINGTEEPQVMNHDKLSVFESESDTLDMDSEIVLDDRIAIVPEEEEHNYLNIREDTISSTMNSADEIVQEKEISPVDIETYNIIETTDEMEQEKERLQETAFISFNELFDNNDNNWDIVDTSAAHVRLEDGKYHIQNRRQSGAYIVLNGPYISTDLDFEIEAHIRSAGPSEDHSYGLIFGAKNKEDFFVFQILPGNIYSIKKYFRGVYLELAGGSMNSRPDSQGIFNVLKINNKENKLSFFINENFINDVPDIYFSNRITGFFIDRETGIVVDKILLHQRSR